MDTPFSLVRQYVLSYIDTSCVPRPEGVFPDPARRWSGGRPPPLAICQTTGLILDPKTGFESSGLKLSGHVAKFYMYVTDDVTGRIIGQILGCLPLLAFSGKAAVSY